MDKPSLIGRVWQGSPWVSTLLFLAVAGTVLWQILAPGSLQTDVAGHWMGRFTAGVKNIPEYQDGVFLTSIGKMVGGFGYGARRFFLEGVCFLIACTGIFWAWRLGQYMKAGTGEKDNDQAVEHLEIAERIYQSADAKGKAKLEKEGVSAATLKDRRDRTEASILEDVKKVNTIEAYSAFLQKFPNSSVARPAAAYRDKLAFDEATKTGTEVGWNAFINSYPTSEMLKDAITNRNKVGAEEALRANTEEVYAAFVKNYPDAIQAPQMKQRLYAVAFENAKAKNTVSALEDYIRIYPESVLVMQAQERLAQLKATSGQ